MNNTNLKRDAKDVNDRINLVIENIKSDYVVGDDDIIKGLNVVKSINSVVNAEIMDDESVSKIKYGINEYEKKYSSNYRIIPRYVQSGLMHGQMIVEAVSKKKIMKR